jgi:SAM-dependent methyltransferase
MLPPLEIGPFLEWPRFPDFPPAFFRREQMAVALRANRWFYDWTVFTPEGLKAAEAYWDSATAVLEALLPERFAAGRSRWSGINLGTFTGAFQKAWMRLGYSMYGIEIAPVIDDLHAYGCQGHQDNTFDLSRIGDARFDFAVLDRVFCQKEFFDRYEMRARAAPPPPYFAQIRRILAKDGAFVGVLYDWYSRSVIEELVSLGGLKLWPMKSGRLAFRVDLQSKAAELPDAMREPLDGPYFIKLKVDGVKMKLFLPANEIVRETEAGRELAFAPPLRESSRPRKLSSDKRAAPL